MMTTRMVSSGILLILVGCSALAQSASSAASDPVPTPKASRAMIQRMIFNYMDSVASGLEPRVQGALKKIPSSARRLLAVKYYLNRSEEEIARKWAWTVEEARAFRGSEEYREAIAEIGKVKKKFAELNPGYQLHVQMEIRSLGSQIRKWNSTNSVGQASAELIDSCIAFFSDSIAPLPVVPDDPGLIRFLEFIRAFEPERMPTVAVPGLSQHGQLRAFDFRIKRRGRLVAGATSSTIATAWDAAGWTAKLKQAIEEASDRFAGPLDEPYEPWHYTYERGVGVVSSQ